MDFPSGMEIIGDSGNQDQVVVDIASRTRLYSSLWLMELTASSPISSTVTTSPEVAFTRKRIPGPSILYRSFSYTIREMFGAYSSLWRNNLMPPSALW